MLETPTLVRWDDAEPWRTTVVHKNPTPHKFPKPHEDVFEQTVNFEAPTGKSDELAAFGGSVFARRTSGVLGTTCDSEPVDMLPLNLAHDQPVHGAAASSHCVQVKLPNEPE